jgi:hypothetical protein
MNAQRSIEVTLSPEMINTCRAVLRYYYEHGCPRITSGNPDVYCVDNYDAWQFFENIHEHSFL